MKINIIEFKNNDIYPIIMESEDSITYSLDTITPCKFLDDKNKNLMVELENNFLNTCYNNKFIIKIKSIDRSSMGRCQTTNNSGKVTFNLTFTVLFTEFPVRTIIPKSQIHIASGQTLATSNHIYMSIMKSSATKILIDKQFVPLILDSPIKYNTSCKHVNAMAHILLPTTLPFMYKIYKIDGNINNYTFHKFAKILLETDRILDMSLTKPEVSKIVKMLSGVNADTLTGSKSTVNILKRVKASNTEDINLTGYWYKNTNITSYEFVRLPDIPNKEDSYFGMCNTIVLSPVAAIKEMLWGIINVRNAVIEISQYSEKEYEESANVWILMNKTAI